MTGKVQIIGASRAMSKSLNPGDTVYVRATVSDAPTLNDETIMAAIHSNSFGGSILIEVDKSNIKSDEVLDCE